MCSLTTQKNVLINYKFKLIKIIKIVHKKSQWCLIKVIAVSLLLLIWSMSFISVMNRDIYIYKSMIIFHNSLIEIHSNWVHLI